MPPVAGTPEHPLRPPAPPDLETAVMHAFRSWDWMTRASFLLATLNVVLWGLALRAIGQ